MGLNIAHLSFSSVEKKENKVNKGQTIFLRFSYKSSIYNEVTPM